MRLHGCLNRKAVHVGSAPVPTWGKFPDTSWAHNSLSSDAMYLDRVRPHKLAAPSHWTVPHWRCRSQVPGPPVPLSPSATDRMFPQPPTSVQFARAAHRTRRNTLLTRSPVYYKRRQLRNSQMGEIHRAKYVGRGAELLCLRGVHCPQHLHAFAYLEALQTMSFRVFMEASKCGSE